MLSARTLLASAIATAVVAASGTIAARADDTPFATLAGTWSGAGQVRLEGGKYEAIRCKAYYTTSAGGKSLRMAVPRPPPAPPNERRANLAYEQGRITGDWEERTYNATGNVAGTSSGDHMTLTIEGGGLNGSLAVRLSEKTQIVSISTTGSTFRGLNLSLTRG